MKTAILAIAMLVGASAYAAPRNCAPVVEYHGDVVYTTYPCATAPHALPALMAKFSTS